MPDIYSITFWTYQIEKIITGLAFSVRIDESLSEGIIRLDGEIDATFSLSRAIEQPRYFEGVLRSAVIALALKRYMRHDKPA